MSYGFDFVLFFVFFFKQKTAYEMRISDWSSDVCSSDLRLARAAQPKLWDYALTLRNKRSAAAHIDVAAQIPLLHVSGRFPASRRHAALVLPIARHPQLDSRIIAFDLAQEIGSASCREGVCQYV